MGVVKESGRLDEEEVVEIAIEWDTAKPPTPPVGGSCSMGRVNETRAVEEDTEVQQRVKWIKSHSVCGGTDICRFPRFQLQWPLFAAAPLPPPRF